MIRSPRTRSSAARSPKLPGPSSARSTINAAPVLSRPGGQLDARYAEHQPSTATQDNGFERALAQLLSGHDERIRVQDTTSETRHALDMLVENEVLERRRGTYRASYIALYSRFLEPMPPSGR